LLFGPDVRLLAVMAHDQTSAATRLDIRRAGEFISAQATVRLSRERELARASREALTRAAARLELRLDAVGVRLSAFGVVDGVPRVVDDSVQAQRRAAIFLDLPCRKCQPGSPSFPCVPRMRLFCTSATNPCVYPFASSSASLCGGQAIVTFHAPSNLAC